MTDDDTAVVLQPPSVIILRDENDDPWKCCVCQISDDSMCGDDRIDPHEMGECNHWPEQNLPTSFKYV